MIQALNFWGHRCLRPIEDITHQKCFRILVVGRVHQNKGVLLKY